MDIQFVRLESDVCEVLNRMAREQRRRVSDLVNQFLREHLHELNEDLQTPEPAQLFRN